MNLKSGHIEHFGSYSNFSSLKEFNTHLQMWLSLHKNQFSKGELLGLKRLVRFAAKVPGISNAKIGTILRAIHDEMNGSGISRSTFKRMIVKATSLGILTVHETERKNGSQSSNLYIFNRFPTNEPPKEEKMNQPNKTSNLSKTKIKEINKRNETELDYTFTSDRVPKNFVNLVKSFFPEANTIEEFWRMTAIAAYRNNREQEQEIVLEIAIHSFKQLIAKLKKGGVSKPIAYYYGILDKKLEEVYFEELYEMGMPVEVEDGGWLEWGY